MASNNGFLDGLIISGKCEVPCQTDPEYAKISSNQCSWCAAEFATNAKKLIRLFAEDKNAFKDLYKQCLSQGSIKRQLNNGTQYGENIDNSGLLGNYQMTNFKFKTIILNNDPSFVEVLPNDLKEEFYSRIHVKEDNIDDITGNIYVMVSRHGQSFTVIPIGDRYLILDSHIHTLGLIDRVGLEKYIKHDHGGHTHVTLIYGMIH